MLEKIKENKKSILSYISSKLLFMLLLLFISLPLFYIGLLINTVAFAYIFSFYFITVLSLSLSYYHVYGNEWKSKITGKLVFFSLIFHYFFVFVVFSIINDAINLEIQFVETIAIAFIISLIFIFMDASMSEPPLHVSKWIFRCFSGKGLTFKKTIENEEEFKLLSLFLSRGKRYEIEDDVSFIYDTSVSPFYTYFMKHNKEEKEIVLQIAKQKWLHFEINKDIESLKSLLISLGFEFVGVKEINNPYFISDKTYPLFSKSKKIGVVWLFTGVFLIFLIKNLILRRIDMFEYFMSSYSSLMTPLNDFAASNPALTLIVGLIGGGIFSNLGKMRTIQENIQENLKKI